MSKPAADNVDLDAGFQEVLSMVERTSAALVAALEARLDGSRADR